MQAHKGNRARPPWARYSGGVGMRCGWGEVVSGWFSPPPPSLRKRWGGGTPNANLQWAAARPEAMITARRPGSQPGRGAAAADDRSRTLRKNMGGRGHLGH